MAKKKSTWKLVAIGAGALLLISLINRTRVMSNLKKIRLGPNFTLDEFVITGTGLENVPGEKEIENLRSLVTYFFQPLRNAVVKKYPNAKVAVIITSGYRSPLVNAAIGGAETSQHKTGEAGDFHVLVDGRKLSNQEVIDIVRANKIPYDQLIDENLKGKQWVHASYSRTNLRRQWLTARDGANGKTVYQTVKVG